MSRKCISRDGQGVLTSNDQSYFSNKEEFVFLSCRQKNPNFYPLQFSFGAQQNKICFKNPLIKEGLWIAFILLSCTSFVHEIGGIVIYRERDRSVYIYIFIYIYRYIYQS